MFDCSFRPQNGVRSIHYMGHVRMMAAVQPFISGAISKTINMPEESTVEDIMDAYTESWRLGLKAVAIYRDNSKRVQPLSSGTAKGAKAANGPGAAGGRASGGEGGLPARCAASCPMERRRITHKFSIGGHEGYITVGLYEDGTPGEVFIPMAKEGSTISGLMDSFATAISYALQYGVPLKFFVDKFSHVRFEPSGWTGNPHGALREVDHGLHLPLAGREVPGPRVRGGRSRRCSEARESRSRIRSRRCCSRGRQRTRRGARSAAG